MDVTLLPPSTILSRHSHLALLPSPFPNVPLTTRHTGRFETEYSAYPRVPYRLRKRYEAPAPITGSSPISRLPDELVLSIFQYLDWDDLVALRPVSQYWSHLALTPALHTSFTISALPNPLPRVLDQHLLKSVRHLYLHLFPYPTHRSGHPTTALLNLLKAIPPSQLKSLSLPFSAPYVSGENLGNALAQIGSNLEYLDLKGSGITGCKYSDWLNEIGKNGPGLSHLDIGFTSISSLEPNAHLFRNLRTLRLASCTLLSESTLTAFLADLSRTIETLDLSRLDNVTFAALWNLQVIAGNTPTALREIKVVGIDHLTRRDVRRLKAHWEEQRRSCLPEIQHLPLPAKVNADGPATRSVMPIKWVPTPVFRPPSPPGSPHTPESHGTLPCYIAHTQPPTPPRTVSPPCDEQDGTDITVNIIHSAILESEDEEGYRQFIGEVANGTMPPGLAMGLGLGFGIDITSPNNARRSSWVEVDGGGSM
jgi:hypothetical protein